MNVKMNIMGAIDLRTSVLDIVKNADNRFLKLVKALAESYHEDDIVSYTVEGQPLTKSEYRQELLDAETEIERGEYTTQEDLEKESENW